MLRNLPAVRDTRKVAEFKRARCLRSCLRGTRILINRKVEGHFDGGYAARGVLSVQIQDSCHFRLI